MNIEFDISYIDGNDAAILDLYTPGTPKPEAGYPGVLIIHGGGWHVGDKSDLRQTQIAELLCSHGYLCININYTLAPTKNNKGPYITQAFQDCIQALCWFREHANELGLNPQHIGAIGGSAGGNMSLMLAATAGHKDFESGNTGDTSIQAVVNLYGPTTRPPELEVLKYISTACPPVLSIHGTGDTVVELDESYALDARMRELNLSHELIVVADAPHTFNLISQWGDFSQNCLDFFNTHLKV